MSGGTRMEKLNQQFKREIGGILLLGGIRDPRVQGVTVTYVDTSKDLSYAHVGFSILSDDPRDVRSAENGLASASGRVRKLLGERVDLRHIPQIKFVYDTTIAHCLKMTQTFEVLHQEEKARGGDGIDTGEEAMEEEHKD